MEQTDRIGQGRVWDGGAARQIGLVDQYGSLQTAIDWAAQEAGFEEGGWYVAYLGDEPGTYDTLLRQWLIGDETEARADMTALFARRQQALAGRVEADLDRLLTTEGAQAYCLECPQTPTARTARIGGMDGGLDGWLGKLAALILN
jgi:protease-4